ncbi:hypothetical protein Syun_016847 [Stephania yunnanensis]|uniref:Uncharacterized protein n=1 Tax=Stephania yunnanensis TaxID=152371 RepID=A0AAP0P4C4_9MAGN
MSHKWKKLFTKFGFVSYKITFVLGFRSVIESLTLNMYAGQGLKDLETQFIQYNVRLRNITYGEELCSTQPIFNPKEDVSVDTLRSFEANENRMYQCLRMSCSPELTRAHQYYVQRALLIRGSRTEPITTVHDLAVQSQALFNIKDSNKVFNLRFYSRSRLKGWSCCRSKHVTGAGDEIWRYVGKLTDAQKCMLDDRFKWKAREMDKRREGKPGEARAALRQSVRDNGCVSLF